MRFTNLSVEYTLFFFLILIYLGGFFGISLGDLGFILVFVSTSVLINEHKNFDFHSPKFLSEPKGWRGGVLMV